MVGQPPTMGYLLNGIHEINTPLGDIKRRKSGYPPVNCPITMENHHFSWENHGVPHLRVLRGSLLPLYRHGKE